MNKNRTILITGGTGLLGSQLVKYFIAKGFTTIFTSRNKAKIKLLQSDLQKKSIGSRLHAIYVDHEKANSADLIIVYLRKHTVWPDSLVNNVINLKHQFVDPQKKLTQRKDWFGELLMDVVVPYELIYKLVNHKQSTLRRIVNISSMYGVVARNPSLYVKPDEESPIQYGVAKAALIHLTKELAVRLASKGIQVNCISYGGVEGRVDNEFKKRYAKLSPMGRMLKKDEIVGAVDFLTSNHSSGMTGHNLLVDGGWTIW